MRKVLIIAIALLIGSAACLYLFIPGKIHVSQAQYFSMPTGAITRCFNDISKIKEWLPAGGQLNGNTINYDGLKFTLTPLYETELQKIIIATNQSDTVNSFLSINTLPKDSSYLYWECTLSAGLSPINRIQQYNKAKKIKNSIDSILAAFGRYTNSQKNVYGILITRTKVVDSILISEKKNFSTYPNTLQEYDLINSLKKYVQDQHGEETGAPMINVMKSDSNNYNMMAAIPIKKIIPETDSKKIKRVLYNGNLLMAETKGGTATINDVFQKMETYKEDYHLQSPAIPYQSVITDRIKNQDTAEWVTKIFYPFY